MNFIKSKFLNEWLNETRNDIKEVWNVVNDIT